MHIALLFVSSLSPALVSLETRVVRPSLRDFRDVCDVRDVCGLRPIESGGGRRQFPPGRQHAAAHEPHLQGRPPCRRNRPDPDRGDGHLDGHRKRPAHDEGDGHVDDGCGERKHRFALPLVRPYVPREIVDKFRLEAIAPDFINQWGKECGAEDDMGQEQARDCRPCARLSSTGPTRNVPAHCHLGLRRCHHRPAQV